MRPSKLSPSSVVLEISNCHVTQSYVLNGPHSSSFEKVNH